ncbi:hypothetical protein CHS0354_008152 [Potamilus streckersoni]|uniref:Anoctamin n=1 Tax=Potamilus streckersoni TaxID=2493646 RepID=A0AAE0SJH2_9BIVA|nr:hypothetical protein CHS0354_008152 [Potamilus streckersoni]
MATANDDDVKIQMLKADGVAHEDIQEEPSGSEISEPIPGVKRKGRNLFFNDGKSRIDYILAWTRPEKEDENTEKAKKARDIFHHNLQEEGLQLELDDSDPEIRYMKVHATWEVLSRYGEILKIKMPLQETIVSADIQKKYSKWETLEEENPVKAVSVQIWTAITGLFKRFRAPFELDSSIVPPMAKKYTLAFSRDREYMFDMPINKDEFFTVSERCRIVDFILRRKSFGEDKNQAFSFGIKKMLADGFYSAAYPVHEGHWKAGSAMNSRKLLYDNWAHWSKFFKIQPLDHIRDYYGEKIGLYFAWLGFYTQMLVPASIMGLIIFIYGIAIMGDSYPSIEICDPKLNITMCPLCDFQCPYWKLQEACSHATASRIFDNNATLFFAIFMSLWGTLFLEFWKRKQAVIQYKWDMIDFIKEEEPPRPEYLAKLADTAKTKVNPITGLKEPHLPFWRRRFPTYLLSYSVMIFMASLAIAGVVGVIAYRVSTLAALNLLHDDGTVRSNSTIVKGTTEVIYKNASLVTTITAALINLALIIILNFIYSKIAFWLTDFECLRTQSEYDDSINIKLFALQFVNYYSSIIYIAFFKGRLVGRPGDYNMVFGARQEECEPGGCLIELCIQLAIIMAGKQIVQNNLIEIALPKLLKLAKRLYRRKFKKETAEQKANMAAWEKDYELSVAENTSLFQEYLEMVLQFGFLTIFVAAFPIGPLCCLLNNIIEIRFDALKFTTDLRRPVAEKTADIGIWFSVLYAISRIAVVSNAFIIALTSDFIPRLVYANTYSQDGSLVGYMNFSLSYFNTSDFDSRHKPPHWDEVQICRYRDYRNPPWVEEKYEYSQAYWHILAARFAFVVVFENVVIVITSLIAWLIPDVPSKLRKKIRREAYIASEIVIRTELMKARGQSPAGSLLDSIISKMSFPNLPSKDNGNNVSDLRKRGKAEITSVDDDNIDA